MPQQVTNNYYNVDPKTGKINAGPYTGLTLQEAKEFSDTFISTEFEGGRHENRVNKITCA